MDLSDALGFLEAVVRLDTAAQVAEHATRHVREVTGARFAEVVAGGRSGGVTVLASSDRALTDALMAARVEAGEPPRPDVALAGSVVVVEDLASASPWDAFAALAVERTPVRSAVLPYLGSTGRRGLVMPVSDDRPGYFTPERQVYVRLVGGLVAQTLGALADGEAAVDLSRGLETRARVGTAVGVLVARRGLGPDAAFALLRSRSQHGHVRLSEVAEQVLADGDLDDEA